MKNSMLIIAAAALLASCGSSNDNTNTGQITLSAAAPFGPHAGETMRAALVRVSDNATLDTQKATVAATGTAFSFTFAPVVDLSAAYKVRYWVDFNSNDLCDAPPTDHQWEADVPAGQSTVTVTHNTTFTSVCSTFTFQLTFVADSTYVGPHSGQPYKLALVHGSDTTAEEILSGNVGTTVGANAISQQFSELLVIGEPYTVKLWIDSNFGGGTVGVCDPKANDHQWSFTIPSSLASHPSTFTAPAHTAATTVDVCSFFP